MVLVATDDKPARRRASPRRAQQKNGDDARARILESALRTFAEHGFDGTTLRAIAAAAGVNHAMLGYYFTDKEELWKEAVTAMFDRLNAEMPPPDNPEMLMTGDGYRDWLISYIGYCARHPEHARIMVQESVRGGARLEWVVETFVKPTQRRLAALMKGRIEAGVLPDVWPVSLSYAIVAACQTPFIVAAEMRALYGVDMLSEEAVAAHAEAVTTLILGPRAGGRPAPRPPVPDWVEHPMPYSEI